MLSFNNLGNLGRLTNQMFQYASLKGIATHRGYEFCIPPKEVFGSIDPMVNKDLNLYDVFDLENKNEIRLTQNKVVPETTHTFDEQLFNMCSDDIDLFGYYQTEKYFKHIEKEIRSDFSFNTQLYDKCSEFIKSLNSEVISLHVRRGDYVVNPNHPVQSIEYYGQALQFFPNNLLVLVFSDDFEWCNRQSIFDDDRFMIAQQSSADADLCMMSLCNYHIIANSTFSWWGAWLANSKKIIAPKNWFAGQCIGKDIKDMAFGNWRIL
jgi:hypothetical protein